MGESAFFSPALQQVFVLNGDGLLMVQVVKPYPTVADLQQRLLDLTRRALAHVRRRRTVATRCQRGRQDHCGWPTPHEYGLHQHNTGHTRSRDSTTMPVEGARIMPDASDGLHEMPYLIVDNGETRHQIPRSVLEAHTVPA